MARNNDDFKFEVIKDFGGFGEGKWQKHLTLVKWGDNEPTLDVRPWNQDMSTCGKGITLSKEDAYDLMCMLEVALEA